MGWELHSFGGKFEIHNGEVPKFEEGDMGQSEQMSCKWVIWSSGTVSGGSTLVWLSEGWFSPPGDEAFPNTQQNEKNRANVGSFSSSQTGSFRDFI